MMDIFSDAAAVIQSWSQVDSIMQYLAVSDPCWIVSEPVYLSL